MPPTDRTSPPFPYGVASFEPTATGFLLWTRTDRPGPVRWQVATDAALTDVVAEGELEATTGQGEASHVVAVDDLAPATDHFYRFEVDDAEPSPVGRCRTLPDDDRPVRIGFACCGDYSAGHFAAYRSLADADVDLVVHLGDYVYAEVEGDLRPVDPDHEAVTADDYRARYEQVRRDPDLQALHQRHPMVAVIDDHDLADNAYEGGAKTHDPASMGPWSERRDAATSQRAEWLPIRADGPDGRSEPAQWRSVRIGRLAELVLLDTRLAGRDAQADEGPPDLHAPERTILGADQLAWAVARIRDRSVPWSIVVSSVVVNEMHLRLPAGIDVDEPFPSGYLVDDGLAINTDGWDGYPAERDRLAAAFRERGSGGVLVSGDVHSAWAFEGPLDGDGPVAVELTCPAVTSEPMGEMVPVVGRVLEHLMEAEHGVRWADLYARGHLVVQVEPASVTGTWYFSDSEDLGARTTIGGSWATRLDRPGQLERVDPADLSHEVAPADGASTPADQRDVPEPVPARPASLVARRARRERRIRVALTAAVTAAVLGRRRLRR